MCGVTVTEWMSAYIAAKQECHILWHSCATASAMIGDKWEDSIKRWTNSSWSMYTNRAWIQGMKWRSIEANFHCGSGTWFIWMLTVEICVYFFWWKICDCSFKKWRKYTSFILFHFFQEMKLFKMFFETSVIWLQIIPRS